MKKILTIIGLVMTLFVGAQEMPIYSNARVYGYLIADDSLQSPKLIVDSILFPDESKIYSATGLGDSVFFSATGIDSVKSALFYGDTSKVDVVESKTLGYVRFNESIRRPMSYNPLAGTQIDSSYFRMYNGLQSSFPRSFTVNLNTNETNIITAQLRDNTNRYLGTYNYYPTQITNSILDRSTLNSVGNDIQSTGYYTMYSQIYNSFKTGIELLPYSPFRRIRLYNQNRVTYVENEILIDTSSLTMQYNSTEYATFSPDGVSINGGDVIESSDSANFIDIIQTEEFDSINVGGYTIRFNESEGVHEFVTAKSGVVWQGALEDLVQVYNNTGSTLTNFTPFRFSGTIGDSIPTASPVGSGDPFAKTVRGLITADIPNNDWGFGCVRGYVRGGNTSGLSQIGAVYLSNDSALTNTAPAYPSDVIVMGGLIRSDNDSGIVYIDVDLGFQRIIGGKSYSFTTQGIGAGTYYKGGFYEESATDANLTQASTTIAFGSANAAKSAHPFIVCGGAGTVDAGVVGLRVTGTYVDDEGNRVTSFADTILTDITAVSTDEYYEAEKYSGTVTYELIVISGSPTTYSFDFNYGYAKYEDIGNRDFYIFGFECVGQAAANDAGFNIELLHHKATGWTYAATGFVAGNGAIAEWSTDLGTEDNLVNGEEFAWKRTNLNTFVDGNGSEGVVIRITTGANNAVQSLDMHLSGALE